MTPELEPLAPPRGGERDVVLGHEYDGIQEYDNPLPGWWSALFVVCVVFAGCYLVYFHVMHWGRFPDQQYRADLVAYNDHKGARDLAEAASVDETTLARTTTDPKRIEHGAAVFAATCVGCHEKDGRGKIGPNLTDRFQLHGETRMEIFHTVRSGVPGTAMIAWGEQLPPVDLLDVAAFVTTLRGTNVEGGKGPQGQPVGKFAP